jgi:DNA/RNA-binding domain of Phe-tRNA-synthetase-like protein
MDFKICEDVSALGIQVAFLVIYDIDNNHSEKSLRQKIEYFYTQFLKEYSIESLENDTNIIGYRQLHETIGVNDKSLIASPESLIKILFKYNSLRPINFIVDSYNYIAIKNKISIGAHDIRNIKGNVRLCFTEGDEQFIPLGRDKQQKVNRGEYCYIDDSNEILCRLDCRQCDKTKITTNTKDCLFIIQGHNGISTDIIKSTAAEIQKLFQPYTTSEKECILKVM